MIRRELKKMGTSLYIIIPKPLAELLGVKDGSPVDIDYDGQEIILSNPKKNILKQASETPAAQDGAT